MSTIPLPSAFLTRHTTTQAIIVIVRRLVETATFTLSAEDYGALEKALQDYDRVP